MIDGVIQSESATLADIGTLDVDHVEIVKGAAGASLYGSRAQNGVIQITTKRGTGLAANSYEVTLRGEYGINSLAGSFDLGENHSYVMNESGTKFIDSNGNEVDFAELNRNGNGGAVPNGETEATTFKDGVFPGTVHDQVDRFYDPGETYSLYAAVTGRFGESSFRVSFEDFKEQGVVDCGSECRNPIALENFGDDFAVRDNGYRRRNARVNVDGRRGQFDIAASGFYSNSVQDDRADGLATLRGATTASPFIDLAEPDEDGLPRIDPDPLNPLYSNPLHELAVFESEEQRSRVMGSLDMSWSPRSWLRVEANASYDRTDFDSFEWVPKNAKITASEVDPGWLETANFSDEAINASLSPSASESFLDGGLTFRGRVRYLFEEQEFDWNRVTGTSFAVEGVPTFGAIDGPEEGENEHRDIKAQGYFGIGSLDYKGRYILDGLIRRDGSSLFGPDERWHTYFRGSAAWRVAQEDWWRVSWVDELKLRFSYGTAGGRPQFYAQYETYGVEAGRIFPVDLGNKALKPEVTTEREAGVNLVLFENLGLDYTYAWATTEDQILQVTQPSFRGYNRQWENIGTIESNTHELALRWAAIDRPDVALSLRLNWDRTRNEITRLVVHPFRLTGIFLIAEGESLGNMSFTRAARTCDDVATWAGLFSSAGFDCGQFQVNDDGYMVFVGKGNSFEDGIAKGLWGTTGEVGGTRFDWGMPIPTQAQDATCLREFTGDAGIGEQCPLLPFLPLGSTTPDWNGALATDFRYRGLTLSLLLDAAVGFEVYHAERWRAMAAGTAAEMDQAGKPEGHKKPLDYYNELRRLDSHFIEDGSWLKVREIALGYTLPEAWLRSVFKERVDRITLSVIGRNLFTFTDYGGYDPEVGFTGGALGSASLSRFGGWGEYPNFRTVSASLQVVF